MQLAVGTSGFSYEQWKGSFYPADLRPAEMLRFYAERLSAVEINNTFYRLPKASVLEGWAAQVPEHFRFAIKASRRITHFKRLKDAGDETRYLLETTAVLGPRLGALLFQLPPNLPCDLDRFERFLMLLPEGTGAAFEFRHESWREPGVGERLAARGFARVAVDDDDAPAEVEADADWSYLRLRRSAYGPDELADWAGRLAAGRGAEALVFFKHEDAGVGPAYAAELAQRFEAMRPGMARVRPRRERRTG